MKNSLYFALLLQKLIGSDAISALKEFHRIEKLPSNNLTRLSEDKLTQLLKYASNHIGFYKKLLSSNCYRLIDFPIVTKKILRSNYESFMSNGLRQQFYKGKKAGAGYSWIIVQSGGTTGIPTDVIHDAKTRDYGRAARMYSQSLCGFPFTTPFYRLWGSMKEINSMKSTLKNRILSLCAQEALLNAFQMSDSKMKAYVDTINSGKIDYMMAYVDAAYQLSLFANKNNIQLRPLKSIMACAGTVTQHVRETIEKTFNCKLYNKYGSRECTDMACECEHGNIHIYTNNVFLEVVDENGSPVPSGSSGRILVTMLNNYSFPIIRYEIGDVGTLKSEKCSCGRPFPLLGYIEGRDVEFLNSMDGGYVSPVFIRHLIGVVHNPGLIKKYQLIQKSKNSIDFIIALEDRNNTHDFFKLWPNIMRDLRSVFGNGMNIRKKIVEDITVPSNGKFLYTINETIK